MFNHERTAFNMPRAERFSRDYIHQVWSSKTKPRNGRIANKSSLTERLTFEKSIQRAWDWLKYTGLHHDLLLMTSKQHRASNIARGLLTLFILLLILATNVFEQIQFLIESWSADNLVKTIPNLLFSVGTPITLWTRYQLWSHHREIKQLFDDWKQMEMQSQCLNLPNMRRNVGRFYYYLFSSILSITFMTFTWNLMEPGRSFFFTHYPVVNETFNPIFVYASTGIIYGYLTLINATNELIPLLFFYHVACVVGNLVDEWNAHLKSELFLRVAWQRYEQILHLVERANKLFGAAIALQNLEYVFMICLCVFYSLVLFRNSITGFSITAIISLSFFIHIVMTNSILSKLYSSTDSLYKSVADLLSEKWYLMQDQDRHLLVSFLARLDKGDMVVRPSNLYVVNPANLLGIFPIVINYIIVLVQSQ